MYVCNAFSLNMLPVGFTSELHELVVGPVSEVVARELLANVDGGWTSAIGHKDTAAVVSGLLGQEIKENRLNVKLSDSRDSLLVAQYNGPRLPEGSTTLPAGAEIQFYWIYVL